jgi:two-component system KDP operon response regulator KdpE
MKIQMLDNGSSMDAELFDRLSGRWANVELERTHLEDPDACLSASSDADFVLIDCSEPRSGGFDLLRAIRQRSDVPVIALVSERDELQEVRALESGADDCVPSTYLHGCLAARVRAVLRRAKLPVPVDAAPNLEVGDLQIRFQDREVLKSGQHVPLTPLEYALLYQLVTHPGRVMPHQALLDRVWGWQHQHDPTYVRLFIMRLRAKLESPDGPRYIHTVHRHGYRFIPIDPAEPGD